MGVKHETPRSFPVLGGYRYGLTDKLELTNFGSLAYRVPIGGRTQLRIDGGIVGYFSRSFNVEFNGDPREPRRRRESATFYGTGITAKIDLGNEVHALYSVRALGSDSSLYGTRIDSGSFSAVAIYDGLDKLSIALPISASYGLNRDRRDELVGGVSIGGFGPLVPATPALSYVATKQIDVFIAPFATLSVDLDLSIGASTGIDWHWD